MRLSVCSSKDHIEKMKYVTLKFQIFKDSNLLQCLKCYALNGKNVFLYQLPWITTVWKPHDYNKVGI